MTTAQINLQSTIAALAMQRGPLNFAENPEKRLFQHNNLDCGHWSRAKDPRSRAKYLLTVVKDLAIQETGRDWTGGRKGPAECSSLFRYFWY